MHAKTTYIAQVLSISLIWIFVIAIAIWIINLLLISIELKDVPGASIGISIIVIPVFFVLAGILTYVFIGLHKEEKKIIKSSQE
ncbi:MAG: hypothetical protein KJ799_07715 [Bacteroidetes bacterium]|nr:hypothetical protein [Bacteroidota bacterium]MBU1677966.1 hypothetical protein [Bacteroidota bacterium]MBU2506594.1 hypothetical protein [Bacteroidota bacterium]